MPNLTDLSTDSKLDDHPLRTSLNHLSSSIGGVVVTIHHLMKSSRVNDEEYDQMSMMIMALQRSMDQLGDYWPADNTEAKIDEALRLGLMTPDIAEILRRGHKRQQAEDDTDS